MVYKVATSLTLNTAETICDAALKEGRAQGFMPLTVVVLDAGGQIVVTKREDGSGIVRFDVAFAKAWGALGMGLPAKTLGVNLGKNPAFLGAIVAASGGALRPIPAAS